MYDFPMFLKEYYPIIMLVWGFIDFVIQITFMKEEYERNFIRRLNLVVDTWKSSKLICFVITLMSAVLIANNLQYSFWFIPFLLVSTINKVGMAYEWFMGYVIMRHINGYL